MCIKNILDFSHLRTSCAPAVGLGDFKKLKPENGAKQPITQIICDVIRFLAFGTFDIRRTSYTLGTLSEMLGMQYLFC